VLPDGTLAARRDGRTRSEAGPAAVVGDIIELLEAVRGEAPAGSDSTPGGIGISAPGPLDSAAGRLVDTPNLGPAFRGLDLTGPIARALGLPVVLQRDTVVALLGELEFGAARGASHAIYLTVSTGVGGAVLTDGNLLAGADGMAGELGHLTVDLDGPPCGCGGRGHLEAIASGSGLARAAARRIEDGAAPGLAALAAAKGRPLSARDLAAAETDGDPDAADLIGRARRAFAAAMVGYVNVFNPEVIVVGGSVAQGQGELLLGPARTAIAEEAFKVPGERVRVVLAALGDDVGLVGAIGLLRRRLST
jgi:glucokinase